MSSAEEQVLAALKADFGSLADANAECGTVFPTWEDLLDAATAGVLPEVSGVVGRAFGPIHYEIARRLRAEYFGRVGTQFIPDLAPPFPAA